MGTSGVPVMSGPVWATTSCPSSTITTSAAAALGFMFWDLVGIWLVVGDGDIDDDEEARRLDGKGLLVIFWEGKECVVR